MFVYEAFGSTALPQYDPNFDASPHNRQNLMIDTAGGQFDAGGADLWPVVGTVLAWRGFVVVDDKAGLQSDVRSLRLLNGKRDRLYRRWHAGGTIEWVYARAQVRMVRNGKAQSPISQPVDFSFIILSSVWYGASHSAWELDSGEDLDTGLLLDNGDAQFTLTGSPQSEDVDNDGDALVSNAIINITAGSAAISSITLAAGEAEIEFTGTIAAGASVVIDCGAMTVTNSGVDAYDDFTLTSNHATRYWFPLLAGTNDVTITYSGGGTGSVVQFDYYDGWH